MVSMTTIHRLHPMQPVCIVCHKPAELTDDDEWQHASTADGITCTVYPMRVTEHPVPAYDAAADYDQHLLDRARELSELCYHSERVRWLTEHGTEFERDLAINGSHDTVYAAVHGRLAATTIELVRWLDRIPAEHRG